MVFLSSQLRLEDLSDIKEEIYAYNWFLLSTRIQNKDIKYDNELYAMKNRLLWYPFIHKEPLFNYLMTDKYYLRSNLYKTAGNMTEIVCMKKIHSYEVTNKEKRFIHEEKRIFNEKNIIEMFNYFRKNNYREISVCEYVLLSK